MSYTRAEVSGISSSAIYSSWQKAQYQHLHHASCQSLLQAPSLDTWEARLTFKTSKSSSKLPNIALQAETNDLPCPPVRWVQNMAHGVVETWSSGQPMNSSIPCWRGALLGFICHPWSPNQQHTYRSQRKILLESSLSSELFSGGLTLKEPTWLWLAVRFPNHT